MFSHPFAEKKLIWTTLSIVFCDGSLKRHILTDTLVAAVVHTANIQGGGGAPDVLASIRARFPWLRHVFANGAYAGEKLEAALKGKGCQSPRNRGADALSMTFWSYCTDQPNFSLQEVELSASIHPYILRFHKFELGDLSLCLTVGPWSGDCGAEAARSRMMTLAKDAMRLLPASAIHGSRSSASFLRIMEWKPAIRLRASTRRGTAASMAAIMTMSALLRCSLAVVISRAMVLADGTSWSC